MAQLMIPLFQKDLQGGPLRADRYKMEWLWGPENKWPKRNG